MKRLGRVLGNLLAVALTVASLQAVAETQLGGRDFNHMTTGYPLLGGHAVAACETCHVGGVFKGTPRNCDGCHALGRRIVATPKSTGHIVTSDPCESCHFNTSTFLGARYNHGTARPGQCLDCHNGRTAQTKPGNHIATTKSCDQCHRTSTWLPASWNHTGAEYVGQDCKVCHNGAIARNYTSTRHGVYIGVGITACNVCHKNYIRFYAPYPQFDHSQPSTANCIGCHDGNHLPIRGIPVSHLPAINTLLTSNNCLNCHSVAVWGVRMNHNVILPGTACKTCHLTGTANFSGMQQKSYGHKGFSSGQDCISCHALQYGKWNEP